MDGAATLLLRAGAAARLSETLITVRTAGLRQSANSTSDEVQWLEDDLLGAL